MSLSLREIETLLSQLPWRQFQTPRLQLEQYATPVHLAARIAHHVALSVPAKERGSQLVVDLGTGTGVLAFALHLAGFDHITGVDIDADALQLAKVNAEKLQELCSASAERPVEFALMDIQTSSLALTGAPFDIAVLNPPFGTRRHAADVAFLEVACRVSRRLVYSLHKSTTRGYISKKLERLGYAARVYAQLRFDLTATYAFHTRRSVDLEVDLWQVELK